VGGADVQFQAEEGDGVGEDLGGCLWAESANVVDGEGGGFELVGLFDELDDPAVDGEGGEVLGEA